MLNPTSPLLVANQLVVSQLMARQVLLTDPTRDWRLVSIQSHQRINLGNVL